MKLQSVGCKARNTRDRSPPDLNSDRKLVVRLRYFTVMLFCAALGVTAPVAAAAAALHPVAPPPGVETGLPRFGEELGKGTTALVSQWSPFIREASRRFGITEDWIKAVMRMESGGHTRTTDGKPITSKAGAMGLMQLMPETWRDMQHAYGLGTNPYDPHDNVLAGAAYLRWLYEKFGYPQMFAAYNAGPGTVDAQSAGLRELPQETRNYVTGIARILGSGAAIETAEVQTGGGPAIFTRPDGSRVAMDPGAVTQVRAALPDEYGPGVQTVISAGPHLHQGVLESLEKVETLLRQHGARV